MFVMSSLFFLKALLIKLNIFSPFSSTQTLNFSQPLEFKQDGSCGKGEKEKHQETQIYS